MKVRYLLAIAIVTATAVAACNGDSTETLSNGQGGEGESNGNSSIPADTNNGGGATTNTPGTGTTPGAPATPEAQPTPPPPTNSAKGLAFYVANVHPFMASQCGTCHAATGPGPAYLTPTDANKSYTQLFQVGYVVRQSRIILKGVHGGATANTLTATQVGTYNQWVETELADGGQQAPPNVLAKLGGCFSRQLFDGMQMGNWRTTQRTANNNTNQVQNWNENADRCTGCDNSPCSTCHSADPATNYSNAVGNNLLPAETTFNNTKMTAPAYITKFFGVSPDGKPVASDGLKKKSDATKKDRAYSHPMFGLNTTQLNAINAFVNDAITKYNAGTCTPTP
jgi:hypothetical protein